MLQQQLSSHRACSSSSSSSSSSTLVSRQQCSSSSTRQARRHHHHTRCSSSSSSSRPVVVVVAAAAAGPRQLSRGSRSAAGQQQQKQNPKVVYLENFLAPQEAAAVLAEAQAMQPLLRAELNCIAVKRRGCYVPAASATAAAFKSKALAAKLTQALAAPFPLFLSDFPIELRQYPQGASMPWHLDEQMFASPQWEVIYTLANSSDSKTEWRDASGRQQSCVTQPNSILAVEAEGWEHRVTPVRRGSRLILKMAFTSSSRKLPAFETNLTRDAYEEEEEEEEDV